MSLTLRGEDLRCLRERAGLSMREIAPLVGRHYTYISKVERGVEPMPEGFAALHVAAVFQAYRHRNDALLELLQEWILASLMH